VLSPKLILIWLLNAIEMHSRFLLATRLRQQKKQFGISFLFMVGNSYSYLAPPRIPDFPGFIGLYGTGTVPKHSAPELANLEQLKVFIGLPFFNICLSLSASCVGGMGYGVWTWAKYGHI